MKLRPASSKAPTRFVLALVGAAIATMARAMGVHIEVNLAGAALQTPYWRR